MRAVVVGYGSIGSRHTRILNELGCRVAVVSSRDIDYQPRYTSIAEAVTREQPQYVVIANKTNEHYDTILELIQCGFSGRVLLEKPVFHNPIAIPENCFVEIGVAYNLRFHPLIQKLKMLLMEQKIISTQVYVGQYLPSWRPGSDYRLSYSACKAEGGGVLRDLSHELDYLNWMLGGWQSVTALGGKYSNLEIDSDDVFGIIMTTQKCPIVMIQLNYLDRAVKREVIVNTEEHTFKLDLVKGILSIDNEIDKLSIERDYTYIAEHQAMLNSQTEELCTLEQGMDVLHLIAAIEQAVEKKGWVNR